MRTFFVFVCLALAISLAMGAISLQRQKEVNERRDIQIAQLQHSICELSFGQGIRVTGCG